MLCAHDPTEFERVAGRGESVPAGAHAAARQAHVEDKVDESVDESFPASDAPAHNSFT